MMKVTLNLIDRKRKDGEEVILLEVKHSPNNIDQCENFCELEKAPNDSSELKNGFPKSIRKTETGFLLNTPPTTVQEEHETSVEIFCSNLTASSDGNKDHKMFFHIDHWRKQADKKK